MKPSPWKGLHFMEACKKWIQLKKTLNELAESTVDDYHYCLVQLEKHFRKIAADRHFDYDKLTIDEIDNEWLRDYQTERNKTACWSKINTELGIITQTRDEMNEHIEGYRRIKKPRGWKSPGKALPKKEYREVVRVCVAEADNPRLEVAALTTLVSIGSGLGPGELKSMLLENVTLAGVNDDGIQMRSTAFVRPLGAKRVRRIRTVVLPGLPEHHAEWAMERLVARAHRLGCWKPDHYLLPALDRKTMKYDPTRPCDGWKTAMKAIYALAEVHFRPYDCRHHAITTAMKDPRVSRAALTQHFGHISEQNFVTYYHGDIEVSETVADAIAGKKKREYHKKPVERLEEAPTQTVDSGSMTALRWGFPRKA